MKVTKYFYLIRFRLHLQRISAAQTFAALESFSLRLLQYLFSEGHLCLMKTLRGHQQMPEELHPRMFELGPLATCEQVEAWVSLAHQSRLM